MTSDGSVDLVRRMTSESSGRLGTTGVWLRPALSVLAAYALSGRSRRTPERLAFASAPWHLKQVFERMGRTSRLNTMAAGTGGSAASAARWADAMRAKATPGTRATRKTRRRFTAGDGQWKGGRSIAPPQTFVIRGPARLSLGPMKQELSHPARRGGGVSCAEQRANSGVRSRSRSRRNATSSR